MLSFQGLITCVLSLFKKPYRYANPNCVTVLRACDIISNRYLFEKFIGDIECFGEWMEPEFLNFIKNVEQQNFHTNDEWMNRRRLLAYEDIVNSRQCSRNDFKARMMTSLKLDIEAFQMRAYFVGDYTDTEEGRRFLFLNCIKNYINRLFLVEPISVTPPKNILSVNCDDKSASTERPLLPNEHDSVDQ